MHPQAIRGSLLLSELVDCSKMWLTSAERLNRTGHLLYTSPNQGQRASIIPPVTGHQRYPELLQWISEDDQRRPSFVETYVGFSRSCSFTQGFAHFSSSLPASLLRSKPSMPTTIHRLVYNVLETAEWTDETKLSPPKKTASFEIVLQESLSSDDLPKEAETSNKPPYTGSKCWKALHTDVDMLMPDR